MSSQVIYKGKIVNLLKIDDSLEVVEHSPSVCILALQKDMVIGVKQIRPAIGVYTWELPAGIVEAGETPEEAARREFAEEVQLTGDFTLITQMYSSPGFCDEKIYLFEATNLRFAKGQLDKDEELTSSWQKPEKIWREIQQGELQSSAPTLLGLSYILGRYGYFNTSTIL